MLYPHSPQNETVKRPSREQRRKMAKDKNRAKNEIQIPRLYSPRGWTNRLRRDSKPWKRKFQTNDPNVSNDNTTRIDEPQSYNRLLERRAVQQARKDCAARLASKTSQPVVITTSNKAMGSLLHR